jgi:sarcosine oxidase
VYGEVAVKAAQDLGGARVTAATRTFEPDRSKVAMLSAFLREHIPAALGPELYTKTCLYTLPPDRDFVVGPLADFPQVLVAVGAGHAFKFAGLIGKILSQLAVGGRTDYDIDAFRTDRPALTDGAGEA